MRRLALPVVLLPLFAALGGCEQPRAHGDANAVIVGVEHGLWAQAEDAFRQGMEPTIQTVRNERPFRITQLDPGEDQGWDQLRRFRQVAVMGTRDTPWIEEALEQAEGDIPSPPAVLTARNVWARDQQVWIMLLPDEDPAGAVGPLAAEVHDRLDEQYRRYVLNRMYVSGRDTLLADSLAREVGFSIQLPAVYRYSVDDTVFRFRNDNPSPTELIREVAVTWWEPAPDENPGRDELESWRLDLTREHYVNPQDLDTTVVSFGPVEVNGASGVEFQSAWMSLPDAWPSGGPFITRAIRCPDQNRMYLMDAWLYAPNREKYEYVIQLQTILDSFRCG